MTEATDQDYILFNPFDGDEATITCRTVKIRTARKRHVCYSLDGTQDHHIEPGQRYRHERALVDGDYWGEYRICLPCMDKAFNAEDEGDE